MLINLRVDTVFSALCCWLQRSTSKKVGSLVTVHETHVNSI